MNQKKGFLSNFKKNLKTKVDQFKESKLTTPQERFQLIKQEYHKAITKNQDQALQTLLNAQTLGHPFHFKEWDKDQLQQLYSLLEVITIAIIRIYDEECQIKELEQQIETLYYLNPDSFIPLAFQLSKVNNEIRKRNLLKLKISNKIKTDLMTIFNQFNHLIQTRNLVLIQEKAEFLKLKEEQQNYYQQQQSKARTIKFFQFGAYTLVLIQLMTGLIFKRHILKLSLQKRRMMFIGIAMMSLVPLLIK